MRNTNIITIVLLIIAVSLAGITVFANDPITEPLIITKKIYYPDPLLLVDFTPTVHVIPPMYSSTHKIDPFMVIEPAEEKVVVRKGVVPTTPLTKWTVGQLELTSVVVNHVFAYAYFTTPGSTKVYRGEVGNHVGQSGSTIAGISPGVITLSNGTSISINR